MGRIRYIEWVRALAACAVVLLHVLGTPTADFSMADLGQTRVLIWSVLQIALTRWAVPAFLMITGALLLDPDRQMGWGKIWGYVRRMLLVLLTFGYVYCLVEIYFSTRSVTASLFVQGFVNLIAGRSWTLMWYVYALLGVYLLLPLLRAFAREAKKGDFERMLLALFVATLLFPTLTAATGIEVMNVMWVSFAIFYVLLGWYVRCWGGELRFRQVVACGIASLVALIVVKSVAILGFGDYWRWIEEPADPLVALYSLAVFLALKRMLDRPLPAPVGLLARMSFGIYLVHPVFLNIANKLLAIRPWLVPAGVYELGMFAAVLAASLALTWGLRKLPVMRRIL